MAVLLVLQRFLRWRKFIFLQGQREFTAAELQCYTEYKKLAFSLWAEFVLGCFQFLGHKMSGLLIIKSITDVNMWGGKGLLKLGFISYIIIYFLLVYYLLSTLANQESKYKRTALLLVLQLNILNLNQQRE